MNKNASSLLGIVLGFSSIFGAYFLEGGSFKILFLLPPMIIVFGGTFAAVLIGFGFERFVRIFHLIKLAYFPVKYNYHLIIKNFIEFSIISRRDGLLKIEKEVWRLDYHFPKKMMGYVLAGTDMGMIQCIAESEIKGMQERHYQNIQMFTKMGGYAPTMGIIGTVMGLIMTLANAGGDPNLLIHNIATAFIATLWGILSANLIWLPIGDKLKRCHLEEKHMMELSLEGILAIQSGEIPSIVKARMLSLLPQKEQYLVEEVAVT